MMRARPKLPQTGEKSTKKSRFQVVFMAIWVLVAVIAAQFLVGILMQLILRENFGRPVWTAVYSAVTYLLALALIILVPPKLFKKWHTSREELGLNGSPTWTDIGLAPVGYIVATIAAAGLVALFTVFPWFNAEEVQNVGFSYYITGGDRVVAFLTLVIVAPIAEEIIFRGWLYGKVRARFGAPVSIIIVSLLFGLVHFQWNVAVNVFALSVVLCCLREITGTIYSGILTHMIKNGVAFYLLYVLGM